MVFAYFR
jgi:hypothetical protein